MELSEEMLIHAVKQGRIKVNAEKVIHDTCYQALCEIQKVLAREHLTDEECFWRIEEIVRIFEQQGSHAGSRHDFG